jgi:hypothetical protein
MGLWDMLDKENRERIRNYIHEHKWFKQVVLLLFIMVIIGLTIIPNTQKGNTASVETPVNSNANIPASNNAKIDLNNIPPSEYKVGQDIPAGEYKAIHNPGDGSYGVVDVHNASPGSAQDSIGTQEVVNGQSYITLINGQYVEVNNCYLELLNKTN